LSEESKRGGDQRGGRKKQKYLKGVEKLLEGGKGDF